MDKVIAEAEERMKGAVEATQREFAGIRSGRVTPALLDKVLVDAYDSKMPVNQLATISVPEPRLMVVSPWDRKNVPAIERAISTSEIGLTPVVEGSIIRLPVPPLTEERRKELAKQVQTVAEDGRVAVRNVRRDANEKIKRMEKAEHLSEDEVHIGQDEIQELTDTYIERLDEAAEQKAEEIMEV
ncbi:MAG: ribosome recycling factor [Armatimonadota bacterium]|jgi:ribosome recycling factor